MIRYVTVGTNDLSRAVALFRDLDDYDINVFCMTAAWGLWSFKCCRQQRLDAFHDIEAVNHIVNIV
jgi:hypothetical protein